jgi:hypothetical protein
MNDCVLPACCRMPQCDAMPASTVAEAVAAMSTALDATVAM